MAASGTSSPELEQAVSARTSRDTLQIALLRSENAALTKRIEELRTKCQSLVSQNFDLVQRAKATGDATRVRELEKTIAGYCQRISDLESAVGAEKADLCKVVMDLTLMLADRDATIKALRAAGAAQPHPSVAAPGCLLSL